LTTLSFKRGEQLPGNENYKIVDSERETSEGDARPLGRAGSSVVYLARYKDALERAIKISYPPGTEEDSDPPPDEFQHTFQREREVLSTITHKHIVKISDWGDFTRDGRDWDYIVMEYARGTELSDLWDDPELGTDEFIGLIDQLLYAVEHLHQNGVLHSDIKAENIKCDVEGQFEIAVLDLGASIVVFPPDGELDDSRVLFFTGSEKKMHETFHKLLRKKWITQEQAESLFPKHDLYCIGTLLKEALENQRLNTALRSGLGQGGYDALVTVKDRLHVHPDEMRYNSAPEVRAAWAKLSPTYLAPMAIPELALAASFHHSMQVDVDTRVAITERLSPVLRHPAFERLRDIRQLDLINLIFPDATHNRFAHSLRAYNVARYYISHLLNDLAFRLEVDRHDIEAGLLIALLHDLGHYPLLHLFEDQAAQEGYAEVPLDDELLLFMVNPTRAPENDVETAVQNAWVEFVGSLSFTEGSATEPLSSLLVRQFSARTLEAFQSIAGVLKGEGAENPAHCVLAGIVSSAIDVDKVAYLATDSQRTGVGYGQGVDFDGLLGSLRYPDEGSIEPTRPILAIRDRGIAAATSVVIARYNMFNRVYWSKHNRSIMAMIKFAIEGLVQAGRLSLPEYVGKTMFLSTESALHFLEDRFNNLIESGWTGFSNAYSHAALNTIRLLAPGNWILHKRVVTISKDGPDGAVFEALQSLSSDDVNVLAAEIGHALEPKTNIDVCEGDVLIDVPRYKGRGQTGGRRGGEVLVYPRSGGPHKRLEEASDVIRGASREFDQLTLKARVFASRRALGGVSVTTDVPSLVATELTQLLKTKGVL